MTNLRQAREQHKLEEFIAEREGQPDGDKRDFDRTVTAMAGKSKPARGTSKKDERDG